MLTGDIAQFQKHWSTRNLNERADAQPHFLELCQAIGVPQPTGRDSDGRIYRFEQRVLKTSGKEGFADVWYQGRFGWEYKRRGEDLRRAYQQILDYREALENPPLLVVCNIDSYQIHTNFTGSVSRTYELTHAELDTRESLETLRAVFTNPERLNPRATPQQVTHQAAARFAGLARTLEARGVTPKQAAHFLVQLLFCFFAEDIGLLARQEFTRTLLNSLDQPDRFPSRIVELFSKMRVGGDYGADPILRFNGGLFDHIDVVPLTRDEIEILVDAVKLDWGSVEPVIFGTLFERSLDPAKRSQLGAHYTDRHRIEQIVDNVLLAPLRARWGQVREDLMKLVGRIEEQRELARLYTHDTIDRARAARHRGNATRLRDQLANRLNAFREELRDIRVLDPACGSGNFLYVALVALLDLERVVSRFGAEHGLSQMLPLVSPHQVHGYEINEYAIELAQVVVWIGYLQWLASFGQLGIRNDPVLDSLNTFVLGDSLIQRDGAGTPVESTWPEVDVIIGNPPFLGGNKIRKELGDEYVEALFRVYDGRVPRFADLVCYFFEKARAQTLNGGATRAGLLATNSIRGGANRRVLDRIKETGDIFLAWPDEPWIVDGAAVRISVVGFDNGTEQTRLLNGLPAAVINADLSGAIDITRAVALPENRGISFTGIKKTGAFDIPGSLARQWMAMPLNPNGRPNQDVLRPLANGIDVTRRPRDMWIIDFGVSLSEADAACYEAPFEYAREHVLPERLNNRVPQLAQRWWTHARPRPQMRAALSGLSRFLVTPAVAKHRIFTWLSCDVLPDHQLNVFARDDDYFLGVLHARAHEVWSLRMGTSLEDRPRYTPTTCFETYPFPHTTEHQHLAIAEAARRLVELRDRWLNPPGATEAELAKRTLTNLYNLRPTWLATAHDALNRAVWSAYGWADDPGETDEETILERLMELNVERARQERQKLPE